MALLFADSFDHYAYADFTKKWTQIYATSTIWGAAGTIGAYGRHSSNGLRVGGQPGPTFTWSAGGYAKTLTPSGSKFVLGMAFKTNTLAALSTFSGGNRVFYCRDAGVTQCTARVNTDGTISVYRGDNATLLGTTSNSISVDTWYYFEFEIVLHGSTGTVNFWVNGVNWLSLTGQNTAGAGTTTWNEFAVAYMIHNDSGTARYFYIDDLYVVDSSGSDWVAAKQSDIRVDCAFPTADGAHTDWTRSTGSTQYGNVDEASMNSDTDYNSSGTPGDKDSLSYSVDMVPGATIHAIQVVTTAKKEDAGTADHVTFFRTGGTDYDGDAQALSETYVMQRQIWHKKPSDSSAWTGATTVEIGYKKNA